MGPTRAFSGHCESSRRFVSSSSVEIGYACLVTRDGHGAKKGKYVFMGVIMLYRSGVARVTGSN